MSGFTPGPWVPRRAAKPDNTGGYDWAIIAPDKAIVAECFEVVDWAENGVDFDTRPVEANARLIAAAPDLLEALQKVVSCFDIKDGLSVRDEQAIKHAASVIHKATGAAS
jgi:hypothetical protein